MSFLQERQARYFFLFILLFLVALTGGDIILERTQKNNLQILLVEHDQAVVSSLLEQGIPEKDIAQAITGTKVTPEGSKFVNKLGITAQADTRFRPALVSFEKTAAKLIFVKGIVLSAVLLGVVLLFLSSRERLYRQAIKTVSDYQNGDFSAELPQLDQGTVYRLFSGINHMASVLRAKQEAEHSTKEFLKNTISDISHQLKTPLAALTMYHEIISAEPGNQDTVAAFSEKSMAALDRMQELIQSLLKITRLDAGGIPFHKAAYPVREILSRAVKELTVRAEREQKEIILSGRAEEEIVCDLQWTSEAAGNLVKNALDHIPPGGQVQIQWEQTPAMARISISDNGTGIAEEDLHHIFKRFYRSKSSMDTQGVGLGLPLAKAIMEGQGGGISVQSKVGEGTVFVLSFLTEL